MIQKYINFQKKLVFQNIDIFNYKVSLCLLILLIISASINFSSRYYEKTLWDKNPSLFYAGGEPLVRTGDPAYYINIAKYLKDGISLNEYYKKLNYPKEVKGNIEPPLLSIIISYLSKDSSLKEIVKASNKIVLYSSIITSFGIFFLFYVIGRPFEGIVASVGGGISANYFWRSSIGYIDTDFLNLFFIYFLFGLIYLSSKKQPLIKNFIFVIFAGLVGKLFYLWYPKPELLFMGFFSLIFFTIFNTKDWKIVLLNSSVYILLTDPSIYTSSLSILSKNLYLKDYLSANIQSADLIDKTNLSFNNIFRYIAEQTKPPLIELFKLEGSIYLGIICFSGLFLWAITYPILFIGLAPLSLFFLLSIILGQRALFYSGPFLWFGSIYFVNFISFKYIAFKKITINKNYIYFFTTLCLITTSILSTNIFSQKVMSTYIPKEVSEAFVNLDEYIEDKDNSIIVADWTYGYQTLLYSDIPILIHPGIPTSPRHYFIARAYTSHSLDETSKILNYVAQGNIEKIESNVKRFDNFQQLSKDLYNSNKIDKDIYFVVTQQQKDWSRNQASIAYWDIEKNKPHLFDGKTAFDIFTIMQISCEKLDPVSYTTMCEDTPGGKKDIPVDLSVGMFNGKPHLKRVVQVTDGKIEINQEYKNNKANFVFQIVKNSKDNTSKLYLMHEAVFRSTYNKLFHLNESEDYQLIYDDYPNVKIYKIN